MYVTIAITYRKTARTPVFAVDRAASISVIVMPEPLWQLDFKDQLRSTSALSYRES